MSTCFLESSVKVFIQHGPVALSAPIVANGDRKQEKMLILESLMVKKICMFLTIMTLTKDQPL